MNTLLTLVAILQSFSISLGVGSSTLAVTNFFVAIADAKIDETERKMMGIAYVVLRVAMILILTTTVLLLAGTFVRTGYVPFSPFYVAQLVVLFVLFLNAVLMTLRIMPSTFGPAFQAGNWYTLGTLQALFAQSLTNFTYLQFFLSYIAGLVLMVSVINGTMAYLKHQQQKKEV